MVAAVVLAAALLFPGPQSERVADAAVVNGVPQGMFVGRSLLSGKAVCLLFLSGGRITRAIPEGGLENFDWNKHRAAHGPDSGSWQMRGGQLVVTRGVKTYQIIQLRPGPDGSASLTLLDRAYPPTESNINVWGEQYLRKAK